MATYISLCRWTQKGIEGVKQSPARLDQFKQAAKAAGGDIKAFYLTMGEYDFVIIAEAPDDASYARMTLQAAMQGNVRTETLKAFAEDEYRQLLSSLG
jgi:uncharacterized protein with GYD domain